MDSSGRIVAEPVFDNAWTFSDGLAMVVIGKKWGFIDRNGQFAVEPVFDDVFWFSGGLARVNAGEKWGLIRHPYPEFWKGKK